MSNIVDRLRQMADAFESEHAPPNLVLHLRAAADEIERLRAALKQAEKIARFILPPSYVTDEEAIIWCSASEAIADDIRALIPKN